MFAFQRTVNTRLHSNYSSHKPRFRRRRSRTGRFASILSTQTVKETLRSNFHLPRPTAASKNGLTETQHKDNHPPVPARVRSLAQDAQPFYGVYEVANVTALKKCPNTSVSLQDTWYGGMILVLVLASHFVPGKVCWSADLYVLSGC